MKCENCGKNEVTFIYRSNINGRVTEKHLCAECAAEQGYTRRLAARQDRLMRGFFEDPFGGSLLNSFFRPALGGRSRFFGEDLFDDFFREMPALTAEPEAAKAKETDRKQEKLVDEAEENRFDRMRRLNALRLEMKKAVHNEEFEEAARLRDEIRALEQEHKESA